MSIHNLNLAPICPGACFMSGRVSEQSANWGYAGLSWRLPASVTSEIRQPAGVLWEGIYHQQYRLERAISKRTDQRASDVESISAENPPCNRVSRGQRADRPRPRPGLYFSPTSPRTGMGERGRGSRAGRATISLVAKLATNFATMGMMLFYSPGMITAQSADW